MTPLRVVIADDHPLFRDGLESLLSDLGAEVIAAVGDGQSAVAAVRQRGADVVLMDLHMPGISGITAAEQLTREFPSVAVLVLTMSEQPSSIHAALRAGARGYLLKEASRDEIAAALDAVSKGQMVVGTRAAQAVRHLFNAQPSAAFPQLREREMDILQLLATGADNRAIARQLFLAEKTVRNRVSDILAKLGVATRAEAIARARDEGLGQHS
ncbi:MAG TPA: response regulator transcription factor [Jatrophihabitans sp.]|nr:response regulator transcription factor [Jatrophihabitans sp.]